MRHRTIASELSRSRAQVILLSILCIVLCRLALPVPDETWQKAVLLACVLYSFSACGITILMYMIYLKGHVPGPNPGDREGKTTPLYGGVVIFWREVITRPHFHPSSLSSCRFRRAVF